MKIPYKFKTINCAILTSLLLSGCEVLSPHSPKLLLNTQSTLPSVEPIAQLQNKPIITEANKPKNELYPSADFGSNLPVSAEQNTQNATPRGKGEFSLNFDDADLGEVAKVILSDILGQNYVLSPKVVGKVTLQTTHALSKEELLPTLEMVLSMNNAALVRDGAIYHIEPLNEALYSANFSSSRQGKFGYQVRVIPVRNVAVDNVADLIKPLLHEKTLLSIDKQRNLLVVSGAADELARIVDMVNTFDIDILKGRSFGLFPLAHVDAETLIKELEEVFYKKAKGEEGEFFRFIPIERLNAILAISHQSRYLKDIEQWIMRLDRANSANGGGVNVYKVQHVDAVELANTLNDIFGNGSSSSLSSSRRDKSPKLANDKKAGELTNKSSDSKSSFDTKKNTPPRGVSSGNSDAKVANVGDVRIVADEANNSLIIVATAQEYEIIRPIVNQLDVMPLQVLVDATIVEVTLTDNLKYGIQWYFNHSNGGQNIIESNDLGALAAGAATGGFGYSFLSKSGDIKAVLNAEASNNNVNVISSPSLMVLNNQEASIQVGKEISLMTGSLGSLNNTNTTGSTSNNVFSQQQQRKTGVKLKIKPRVNANGLVTMEVTQSVEDPGAIPANGTNPSILTREINSSVAVQSGETIVLGGLIKDNNTDDNNGLPLLHDIPILGTLFGSKTRTKDKTELVVLITPRVVKSRQDAGLITDEFKRKLSGIYENNLDDLPQ
ncbi:MAG: type II secretion system secretin GspD [Methylococcales bacterium]|nr:type II secretion system secretin GspD [Methylococcales bacterium]